MPTLVTSYHSGELDGTYILPPVKYPDGNSTSKNPTMAVFITFRSLLSEAGTS